MLRVIAASFLVAGLGAQGERVLLAPEPDDSIDLLRAIGSADRSAAEHLAASLRERLAEQPEKRLQLLRSGCGHGDDRVVFGAVVLNGGDFLPIPELRHAAEVVVRSFGKADCPVSFFEMVALQGSRDVPAALARIPEVPAETGARWLGELHRLVRAEHVPALCRLALASAGDVQRRAFEDAWFVADYSGQQVPLVVATWLQLVGGTPDPDGEGLPGVLTAAMRWMVEDYQVLPPRPPMTVVMPPPGPREPDLICRRWLATSRATPHDWPLLRHLITADRQRFTATALYRLGDLSDPDSHALLRTFANDDDDDFAVPARAALARRGDVEAKAALRDDDAWTLPYWLQASTPAERRDWFRRLLTVPPADAVPMLRRLCCDPGAPTPMPAIDDAWFADLEAQAAAVEVDARVLRELVTIVPACTTKRLAAKLLAMPVDALFGELRDADGEIDDFELGGEVGFRGVWPFLEVTSPETFAARLRQGLGSTDPQVRDACARLLLRLSDPVAAGALLAWLQGKPRLADDVRQPLLLLARSGAPGLREVLQAKLQQDGQVDWDAARALACWLGMPFETAARLDDAEDDEAAVLAALRDGDAVRALFAWCKDSDALDAADLLPLRAWQDPRLQAWVWPRLHRLAARSAESALAIGIATGDAAVIAAAREMIEDGRYVTHHVFHNEMLTLGKSTQLVPFWLQEYGTNCCRRCVASEAVGFLFHDHVGYGDRESEPTGVRLQRRLLPRLPQMRWSRLSGCFVVAGQ